MKIAWKLVIIGATILIAAGLYYGKDRHEGFLAKEKIVQKLKELGLSNE